MNSYYCLPMANVSHHHFKIPLLFPFALLMSEMLSSRISCFCRPITLNLILTMASKAQTYPMPSA